MYILIIEQPLNNRGDESAHRGLVNKLVEAYPNARINVLFINGQTEKAIQEFKVDTPNVEYTRFPLSNWGIKWEPRIIKLLMMLNLRLLLYILPTIRAFAKYCKKADYVLCAPGGINMGGFKDWKHLAYLFIAKDQKRKIIYYGRSIGPFYDDTFTNRLFKKRSTQLLKYFTFTSLREKKSQEIAEALGVPFVPTIDSAFLKTPTSEIPIEVVQKIGGQKFIAFVPNSLAWHHNFKDYTFDEIKFFWVELQNKLAVEYPDHKFVMLPQTIGYSKWLLDGYRFFCEIKEQCTAAADRVFVLPEKYGSDIQQAIISKAEFLIGARYHSIIFAINQCVPFVSLSYEHKMSGVLKELNKQECEVDITNKIGHSLKENTAVINQIISMTHTIKADPIAQQLAHKIASDCFHKLENILR